VTFATAVVCRVAVMEFTPFVMRSNTTLAVILNTLPVLMIQWQLCVLNLSIALLVVHHMAGKKHMLMLLLTLLLMLLLMFLLRLILIKGKVSPGHGIQTPKMFVMENLHWFILSALQVRLAAATTLTRLSVMRRSGMSAVIPKGRIILSFVPRGKGVDRLMGCRSASTSMRLVDSAARSMRLVSTITFVIPMVQINAIQLPMPPLARMHTNQQHSALVKILGQWEPQMMSSNMSSSE